MAKPQRIPWYFQTWLIVIAFILFLPAGIILAALNPYWNKTARITIPAIGIVILIGSVVFAVTAPPSLEVPERVLTNKTTYSLRGETNPETKVVAIQENSTVSKTTSDDDGDFTLTINNLEEGENNFTITAGSTVKASENVIIVLDTKPPSAPSIESVPGETTENKTVIKGQSNGDRVTFYINDKITASEKVENNRFRQTLTLVPGINEIDVYCHDAAGNTSEGETVSVDYKPLVTIDESVPRETREIEDPDMMQGETEVREEGSDGTKTVTYKVTYRDGKETGRKVVDETITSEPQDKVIAVGTKKPAQWTTVATMSGSGDEQSDTFDMTEGKFRVKWSSSGGEFAVFYLSLIEEDTDLLVTDLASADEAPDSGIAVIHHTGRYYVEVLAANTDWTVEIQELN